MCSRVPYAASGLQAEEGDIGRKKEVGEKDQEKDKMLVRGSNWSTPLEQGWSFSRDKPGSAHKQLELLS